METLEAAFAALEAEASAVAVQAGAVQAGTGAPVVHRLADGRYLGQGYALVVPLPPGPYGEATRPALQAAFETEYRRRFARSPPDVGLEFVAARVSVHLPAQDGGLAPHPAAGDALKGHRPAWFDGAFLSTPVYDRARLGPGARFGGPALVEDPGSTLVIGPGPTCLVSENGSILVEWA